MVFKKLFTLLITVTFLTDGYSQGTWKGKKCAVVLTYDDALNVHLDKVIPALDSIKLRGTFYLIGSSPVVSNRIDEWRSAAKRGHELGNHSLIHPCNGSLPGRGFVTAETDLSKYTVSRAVNEIRIANTLFKAIDGKDKRTFAFPCGDLKIGDTSFYDSVKSEFAGARGVNAGVQEARSIDLNNINALFINNHTGEQMIEAVKEAERKGGLLVFLFHGVGGEHNLNVSLAEHKKLISYLKRNEKNIWITPMVEAAEYIKSAQKGVSKAGGSG